MPARSLPYWLSRLSGLELSDRDQQSAEVETTQLETTQPRSAAAWLFGGSPLLQTVSRSAMACEFEVVLNERQYGTGVAQAIEALDLIGHIENLLSVYRPQSQISKVNQFGNQRPVLVDALTLELVELAIDAHVWTEGAFDVTAGSLSEVWGFSRRQGTMPSQEDIQKALAAVGTGYVRVDEAASTIGLDRPGVRINPGGIGKGFALDHAARQLTAAGIHDFMIHGGLSSIVARGHRQGLAGGGWRVALKHPWRAEETLEMIPLFDQALGTSGSGKQFFHFGGQRYSHLIDPRSGWPAQQMMSATVICPSGGVADALATGLFILGVEKAREFCEAHPEISAVLIHADPKSGSQRIQRCNWQPLDE